MGHSGAQVACATGFLNGSDDAFMGTATAKVLIQGHANLLARRLWDLLQQDTGSGDDAAQAIAALAGVFFDEGGLENMRHPLGAQAFERGDFFSTRIPQRQVA